MKPFVQRTVSELDSQGPVLERQHLSIDDYRSTPAWVLLGDPGSGKTRQFHHEVEQCRARGERVEYITARNFATFGDTHGHWAGATLFIDALDEVRAGGHNGLSYFDLIRKHLDALGRPKFRISCRHADWLGEIDRSHLADISGNSQLVVLTLDRFNSVQFRTHLESYNDIGDIEAFIKEATENQVEGQLSNPQTTDMFAHGSARCIKAVGLRLRLVTNYNGFRLLSVLIGDQGASIPLRSGAVGADSQHRRDAGRETSLFADR